MHIIKSYPIHYFRRHKTKGKIIMIRKFTIGLGALLLLVSLFVAEPLLAATKLGTLTIRLPESTLLGVNRINIVDSDSGKVVKEEKLWHAVTTLPMASGNYEIMFSFNNSNHRPPTEAMYGKFSISGGRNTTLEFGAIAFDAAEALKHAGVQGVTIINAKTKTPLLTVASPDNNYYVFKAKPVPPGSYDIKLHYFRSPQSIENLKNISVSAKKITTVSLNSGIKVAKPELANEINSWELIPSGRKTAVLKVNRDYDNPNFLWQAFAVPPGKYRLRVSIEGLDETMLANKVVVIKKGNFIKFDSGF